MADDIHFQKNKEKRASEITFREYAAIQIAAGMMPLTASTDCEFDELAHDSVMAADALIAKLGKE